MRRNAITSLNLADINFDRHILSAVEKDGSVQPYPISRQGMAAISDYLEQEKGGGALWKKTVMWSCLIKPLDNI
jgi:site-specific recombinase XerD